MIGKTNLFHLTSLFPSDRTAGHLIFKSKEWKTIKAEQLDYLIVGGGIAGLTAAQLLKDENCLLFELGQQVGGSSSADYYQNTVFSQGAHYDWSYPANYGKEVLALFKELQIIEFNKQQQFWNFIDKQYLIKGQESQSLVKGQFHDEYLEEFDDFQAFFDIIKQYANEMLLPTRLINEEIQQLNQLTFLTFLQNNGLNAHPDFLKTLSYQLIDDYGAGVETVSALAGIHYYLCRPYYTKEMELFSPPQGNFYFTGKLKTNIQHKIKTNHVVKKITKNDTGFLVDVIDIRQKIVKQYSSKQVIYAGQKHALQYILPEQYPAFKATVYSPWVVVNVVLNTPIESKGIWQNEFPLNTDHFMGFVDSKSQKTQDKQVLTCYYCFPPEERKELPKIEDHLQDFTRNTIEKLNTYFDTDLHHNIEKVFIKVMGHAMPIPTTAYLFDDKNENRLYKDLVFAGVDIGRLPLLFEAVDSGIEAVNLLKQK